ncbi:MAG: MFS transporter, partial [Flavobacteriales bacterium]|nr:MFS transporter [Flavobacteriales bacterium]
AYNLVITSAIFPIFYELNAVHRSQLVDGKMKGFVTFFGREFVNTELYSYVLAASFLVVSLLIPILSGIADSSGSKKGFMKFFCYLGSAACVSLYFFDADKLELSMISPFIASIGFWGSFVFYNSYLPEIATPDRQDRLSAKGYALGYIGSVILLTAIIVAMKTIDAPAGQIPRLGFLAVGLWWAGFAQITYSRIPSNVYDRKVKAGERYLFKGYRALQNVWKELVHQKNLSRFLVAFFVFNMGVQTIMQLAPLFAASEIDWPLGPDGKKDSSGLIISILLIQLVAVVGAIVMSRLAARIGNFWVIRTTLVIWLGVCLIAFFIHTPTEFYALAALVGFVMGGIQSMSRSTYSKMLPETTEHASYFSFYDVLEKVGLIIGPFLYGYVTGLFNGNMRPSVLVLASIFVVGFGLMFAVRSEPKSEVAN